MSSNTDESPKAARKVRPADLPPLQTTPTSASTEHVLEKPAGDANEEENALNLSNVSNVSNVSSNTDRGFNDSTDEENMLNLTGYSISTEKAFSCNTTPDPVKARRFFHDHLHMNSPSDALMSPCTAKLMGRGNKKGMTGPSAVLRMKQKDTLPFNIDKD